MNSHVEQLESLLETNRANYKGMIERAERLARLKNNPDFCSLILDEFMVKECANYTRQSCDPNMPLESRADALAIAQAAGHLNRWLYVIERMATEASNELVEIEDAIQEARSEGLED